VIPGVPGLTPGVDPAGVVVIVPGVVVVVGVVVLGIV